MDSSETPQMPEVIKTLLVRVEALEQQCSELKVHDQALREDNARLRQSQVAQGRRIDQMSDSQQAMLSRHEVRPGKPRRSYKEWREDLQKLADIWGGCGISAGHSSRNIH
jgi:hypothetical protein